MIVAIMLGIYLLCKYLHTCYGTDTNTVMKQTYSWHQVRIGAILFFAILLNRSLSWLCSTYRMTSNIVAVPLEGNMVLSLYFVVYCVLPSILLPALFLLLVQTLCPLINIWLEQKACLIESTDTSFYTSSFFIILMFCSVWNFFSFFVGLEIYSQSNMQYVYLKTSKDIALNRQMILMVYFVSLLIYGALMLIVNLLKSQITYSRQIMPKKRLNFLPAFLSVCFCGLSMLAILFIYSFQWVLDTFGTIALDQILFQLRAPLKGTNTDFFLSFIFSSLVPTLLLSITVALVIFPFVLDLNCYQIQVSFNQTTKARSINFTRYRFGYLVGCPLLLLLALVCTFGAKIDAFNYINSMVTSSDFFDNNYVNPEMVSLEFPEKKQNLLYIFVESMENTFASREVGGFQKDNLIPELTEIAAANISFSNTDKLGGSIEVYGTSWTMAAMVSQHAGIPLMLPMGGNDLAQYEYFMPNVVSLGDILQEEGYNQTLLVGSDAEFGGRRSFYQQHGNYNILDLETAWRDGIVPDQRKVFWGFEDMNLYKYAQLELERLAAEDAPFNLTMLTVDTHHVDGYRCPMCEDIFEEQYWNAVRCASKQLSLFLDWVKEQDFYENTTVVITGDHTSMAPLVKQTTERSYQRTTYNVFINSLVQTSHTKNRDYSSVDLFPTTLASLGVTIQGDQLGLGVNLFSDRQTLLECYGKTQFNKGINGHSRTYNSLLY